MFVSANIFNDALLRDDLGAIEFKYLLAGFDIRFLETKNQENNLSSGI